MKEYEVFVEDINHCGGEKYAKKEFREILAQSPEAYVRECTRLPIIEVKENARGETVILTGDGHGNFLKFTFSE